MRLSLAAINDSLLPIFLFIIYFSVFSLVGYQPNHNQTESKSQPFLTYKEAFSELFDPEYPQAAMTTTQLNLQSTNLEFEELSNEVQEQVFEGSQQQKEIQTTNLELETFTNEMPSPEQVVKGSQQQKEIQTTNLELETFTNEMPSPEQVVKGSQQHKELQTTNLELEIFTNEMPSPEQFVKDSQQHKELQITNLELKTLTNKGQSDEQIIEDFQQQLNEQKTEQKEQQTSESVDIQGIALFINSLSRRNLNRLCYPLGIQQKTKGVGKSTALIRYAVINAVHNNPQQVIAVIRSRLPDLLPS